MTEEIIIDCAFYKDGVCASPINKTCEYCKNIDVSKCYHKQLIRLKQQHNDDTEEIAKLGLDVAILEQENKDLKDNNNHLQAIIDDGRAENKRFREENKELKENLKSQQMINLKQQEIALDYWNALEEINRTLLGVRGLSINCDRQIGKVKAIINEVLGEK